VRSQRLEAARLIANIDVTEKVQQNCGRIQELMEEAQLILRKTELPVESIAELTCKPGHCGCTNVSYQTLPEYSVFNLRQARRSKVSELLSQGKLAMLDLTLADIGNSNFQATQIQVARTGQAHIDIDAIRNSLQDLRYPLYFLDYETCNFAIPRYTDFRAWEHLTNQFSLHVQREFDGQLEHFEFLSLVDADCSQPLAEALRSCIADDDGSVIVWSEAFEKSRNGQIGEAVPHLRSFFDDLNVRVFDLMKVFSQGHYIDERFAGSTSIKKVLPILCPQLSYAGLAVQNGQKAIEHWYAAAVEGLDESETQRVQADLLAYCKLDTLAMVEIFRSLQKLWERKKGTLYFSLK